MPSAGSGIELRWPTSTLGSACAELGVAFLATVLVYYSIFCLLLGNLSDYIVFGCFIFVWLGSCEL